MHRLLVFLVYCLSMPLQANEDKSDGVSFALVRVPGVMQHDMPDAPYNRFLSHIANRSELAITSAFYPYSRGEMLMRNNTVDCIFPVVKGEPREEFSTLYSDTINVVSVFLFSLHSEIKSFADIPDKTVVYLDSYDFGYWGLEGKEQVNLVAVGTQKSALNVLKSGRAMAYMDYFPDIKISLSNDEFSGLRYSPAHPIRSFEDIIECVDTEKNRAFVQWLNKEISRLNNAGEMQALLGEFYNIH